MRIAIIPIVSSLHHDQGINQETKKLLDDIKDLGPFEFVVGKDGTEDLTLILVQSGGSEGLFLKMEEELEPPYYLLTYGSNNSLAASMEILSYLKDKGEIAQILHGTPNYIAKQLLELGSTNSKPSINLGVIGKPSDWLIASNVDYHFVKNRMNIQLIDIDIQELIDLYHVVDVSDYETSTELVFNEKSVKEAKKVSLSLRRLVDKYHLEGLTIRCFDLLDSIHTTGCLGISLLNRDRLIGTCEGDIPAMLSMYLLKQITGQSGFQANPSRIDTDKNHIVFAHCTLPLDMAENYQLMTHFESGIGVGIRGKMKSSDITLFKIHRNLKDYYVAEGKIIENLEEDNLCRTQIVVSLDDVGYFLNRPYGNHHIIVYGKHKQEIERYMANL